MAESSTINSRRARVSALSRHREADDPELLDASRDLRAATLEQHVARVVAEAPPLTPAQRHHIAAILTGGAA